MCLCKHRKKNQWILYDWGHRHERVKDQALLTLETFCESLGMNEPPNMVFSSTSN